MIYVFALQYAIKIHVKIYFSFGNCADSRVKATFESIASMRFMALILMQIRGKYTLRSTFVDWLHNAFVNVI